jgi:hypothetical protein
MKIEKNIHVEDFIYFCIIATFEIVKRCKHEDFSFEVIEIIRAKYYCNNDIAASLFRPIYWYLCINTDIIRYNYDFKKWEIDYNYKELDEKKINKLIKGIKERYEFILYNRIMHLKEYVK